MTLYSCQGQYYYNNDWDHVHRTTIETQGLQWIIYGSHLSDTTTHSMVHCIYGRRTVLGSPGCCVVTLLIALKINNVSTISCDIQLRYGVLTINHSFPSSSKYVECLKSYIAQFIHADIKCRLN